MKNLKNGREVTGISLKNWRYHCFPFILFHAICTFVFFYLQSFKQVKMSLYSVIGSLATEVPNPRA